MSSAAWVSSSSRPLKLRLRADLVTRAQHYQGRQYWVIKDPISLKYYRFEDEEYTLLTWLDGSTSLDQLRRRFESRFAPQRISSAEVHQFLGTMFRQSLLISEATGQGESLYRRADENRRKRWKSAFSSILAIRFRGIDPDRLLGVLNRWFGWLFTVPVACLACLLGLSALALVFIESEAVAAKLPAAQAFFGPSNWLWLAVTLSLTKVLHELGHGIACRKFGGRSHEMGVMLLLFMPCLYCNVTDSWMIPSRWRRAAVAAAGMYVELILASICTFLWWFSQPGLFNTLCLNIMFVGSVTTLLFNANPLMRYDGYYILSDLIEIPNLRQKANAVVQRWLLSGLLGIRQRPDPFLPHRHRIWFGAYSLAAVAYRWLISITILGFLYQLLESYQLKFLGQALILSGIYGLVVHPLIKAVRFLATPGRLTQMNPLRASVSAGLIGALCLGALLIPFPYYVPCAAQLRPAQASTVFVDTPGRLVEVFVAPGEYVQEGQPLMRLENEELLEQLATAHGSWRAAQTQLEQTQQRRRADETAWDLLPSLEESVRILKQRFDRLQSDVDKLVIRAPRAGVLLAPLDRHLSVEESDQLPQWSGSPFSQRNIGAWLQSATALGQIGEPERLEAVLVIGQDQLEFVAPGDEIDVLMPHQQHSPIATQVKRIAATKIEQLAPELDQRFGGPIASTVDASGRAQPQQATYEVSCSIVDENDHFAIGQVGQARVLAGRRNLGQRLIRYAQQTFAFEL